MSPRRPHLRWLYGLAAQERGGPPVTLPDVIAYAERTLREFHLGGTRATTVYGPAVALARTLRALRAVKKVMDDADGRYGADAGVLTTDELRTAIEEER